MIMYIYCIYILCVYIYMHDRVIVGALYTKQETEHMN